MDHSFDIRVDDNMGNIIINDRMIEIKYNQIRIRDSKPRFLFLRENIIKYSWLNNVYKIEIPNSENYHKIRRLYNIWF